MVSVQNDVVIHTHPRRSVKHFIMARIQETRTKRAASTLSKNLLHHSPAASVHSPYFSAMPGRTTPTGTKSDSFMKANNFSEAKTSPTVRPTTKWCAAILFLSCLPMKTPARVAHLGDLKTQVWKAMSADLWKCTGDLGSSVVFFTSLGATRAPVTFSSLSKLDAGFGSSPAAAKAATSSESNFWVISKAFIII